MSGDVAKSKQRNAASRAGKGSKTRAKAATANDENGKTKLKKEMTVTGSGCDNGRAGLCTKLVFYLLLASLGVTLTVVYVDYQHGQLKAAYEKFVPPEVRTHIVILCSTVVSIIVHLLLWRN